MPISNLDVNLGRSKRVWGLIKHEVAIQVNPIKLIDYTIMWAHMMVTHGTS